MAEQDWIEEFEFVHSFFCFTTSFSWWHRTRSLWWVAVVRNWIKKLALVLVVGKIWRHRASSSHAFFCCLSFQRAQSPSNHRSRSTEKTHRECKLEREQQQKRKKTEKSIISDTVSFRRIVCILSCLKIWLKLMEIVHRGGKEWCKVKW